MSIRLLFIDDNIAAGPTLPPDPATVAPPLDPTIAATHQAGISFLYTGANPIQTGGVPGTINSVRGAAIRGGALRKASFLLDRVGTVVFPEFVMIAARCCGSG